MIIGLTRQESEQGRAHVVETIETDYERPSAERIGIEHMSEEAVECDAVRVLFLLYYCGTPIQQIELDLDPVGRPQYTHSIESESKLQKLDFWLRYPDHLAAALLRGCEDQSLQHRSDEIKALIRLIFTNEEPDLRGVDMIRYFYGAYEPLDDVLRFLLSRSLVYRRQNSQSTRTQYYLMTKGKDVVEQLVQEVPDMQWYVERCTTINEYFGSLDGYDLRKLQYLEHAYHYTAHNRIIPQVTLEVNRRFQQYFGETL